MEESGTVFSFLALFSLVSPSPLSLVTFHEKHGEGEESDRPPPRRRRACIYARGQQTSVGPPPSLRRRPVLPCAERGSFGGVAAVNLSQVMQTRRHRAHESHAGGNSVRSGEETSDGGGIRRRLSRPPQRSHSSLCSMRDGRARCARGRKVGMPRS